MKKIFSFVLALCAACTVAFADTSLSVDCGASAQITATPKTGYHFTKWNDGNTDNPRTVTPTANVTYTAYFAIDTFTITFKNYDGAVLQNDRLTYGSAVTAPATPSKPSTVQYNYTFSGWTPTISYTATADAVYTAEYTETVRQYTITFKDENGTVLQSTEVAYGTVPTAPADPTKASTAEFTYTFKDWGETVSAVTGEKTYTAVYTATKNQYTVTFKNYDGTVLQTGLVEYGTIPTYTGATPTKPADAGNTYVFSTWDTPLAAVTGEVTYTATFTSSTNSYTVTLSGDHGTYTGAGTYTYGTEITIKATADDDCYEFVKWSDDNTNASRTITVNGAVTLTATFKLKQYTVTVESDNETQGTVSITLVP